MKSKDASQSCQASHMALFSSLLIALNLIKKQKTNAHHLCPFSSGPFHLCPCPSVALLALFTLNVMVWSMALCISSSCSCCSFSPIVIVVKELLDLLVVLSDLGTLLYLSLHVKSLLRRVLPGLLLSSASLSASPVLLCLPRLLLCTCPQEGSSRS